MGDLDTRLYAIADAQCLGTDPEHFAGCVVAMVRGGIRTIQLRLKPTQSELATDDVLRCAMIERTLEAIDSEPAEVMLWLDDRADLAACFAGSFVGVHVGQQDLPPSAVQRVLGAEALVGLSCHDLGQVARADADPAVDWVAIGPVFTTGSKVNPEPVVGLEGVRAARAATSKPLVAIGGVNASRIPRLLATGVDAVVVLSALVAGGRDLPDIEREARRLVAGSDTDAGSAS